MRMMLPFTPKECYFNLLWNLYLSYVIKDLDQIYKMDYFADKSENAEALVCWH